MSDIRSKAAPDGERLAKIIARAGLCSRRDAEKWIADGRVKVNGKVVRTPAFNVISAETVLVDNKPLGERNGTRVWLYHKPAGLVVTEKDPEGRPTIFETLEKTGLPRVISIGRLDINTEGLLLLTNDGGLKRVLELPATGWLRKYRVRAFGNVTQAQLDSLAKGIEFEGIKYGPIEATLERDQGSNVWLVVALREGKNREIKNVLGALGLQVNRLIRISYGPFQLADLPIGAVSAVKSRVLRDQLGARLAKEAGVDFDGPMPDDELPFIANPNARLRKRPEREPVAPPPEAKPAPKPRGRTGEPVYAKEQAKAGGKRKERPDIAPPSRWGSKTPFVEKEIELRTVHFDDGRESAEFQPRARRPKSEDQDKGAPRRFGSDRPGSDRAAPKRFADKGEARSFSKAPGRDRPGSDRPSTDRPATDRPSAERSGAGRPSTGRPSTGRPGAGRPGAGRPGAARPASARPDAARSDRAAPKRFADKGEARSFSKAPGRDRPSDSPARPRPPRAEGDAPRPPRRDGAAASGRPARTSAPRPARSAAPRSEGAARSGPPKARTAGAASSGRPARSSAPRSGPPKERAAGPSSPSRAARTAAKRGDAPRTSGPRKGPSKPRPSGGGAPRRSPPRGKPKS